MKTLVVACLFLALAAQSVPQNQPAPGSIAAAAQNLPNGGVISIPPTELNRQSVPDFLHWPPNLLVQDFRNGGLARSAFEASGTGGTEGGSYNPFQSGCFFNAYPKDKGTTGETIACNTDLLELSGPGYSIGNPGKPFTFALWQTANAHTLQGDISSAGIHTLLYGNLRKSSVGDTSVINTFLYTKFGGTAASDEQVEHVRNETDELGEDTAVITQLAPQADAPTQVTVAKAGNYAGAGQVVIDLTQVRTGTQTRTAMPQRMKLPYGMISVKVTGMTLTPSTCSTLTENVLPTRSPTGAATSETFTVAAPLRGIWHTGARLFLMGLFPESIIPTGVQGNTITAPVANQHAAGEMVCQGGPAGWALDQASIDPGGHHYVQFVVGALDNSTLMEGAVCGGHLCNFETDGEIHLYPASVIVSGFPHHSAGLYDFVPTFEIQPGSGFVTGDKLAFPNNISGGYVGYWTNGFIVSPYAYQRGTLNAYAGMESLSGSNFLGVWNLGDQHNLNVQTAGNHKLYAPHGFVIGEDGNSYKSMLADLWTLGSPPVGGQDYGNPTRPHLLGISNCWPAGTRFTPGISSFDIFDEAPDGAALSYTPSCKGAIVGALTWNGTLNVKALKVDGRDIAAGQRTASDNAHIVPGNQIASVRCVSATCTNLRGTLAIVGGNATRGTLASLSWTSTPSDYVCEAHQNGGARWLGIGNTLATRTGMSITADVPVTGAKVTISYSCQP